MPFDSSSIVYRATSGQVRMGMNLGMLFEHPELRRLEFQWSSKAEMSCAVCRSGGSTAKKRVILTPNLEADSGVS